MQIVHIDKQTKMLDSPSIIADPSNSALALALRSIIDTEESDSADVLEGVDAILNHCSKQQVSSIFFPLSHWIWLLCRLLRPKQEFILLQLILVAFALLSPNYTE